MDGREAMLDALDRVSSALNAELSTFDDARKVLVFARCLLALIVSLK